LEADRAARDLGAEPERALELVRPRGAMRARHDQAQLRGIRGVAHLELERLVADLVERAIADDAAVELAGRRLVHDAEPRLAVDREADHHRELAVLRDELLRSVQRIDVPAAQAPVVLA